MQLIGYASGIAGADKHVQEGPLTIQQSVFFQELLQQGFLFHWNSMVRARSASSILETVKKTCEELALIVSDLVKKQERLMVVGGDHTCAIGTFSGVYDAIHQKGDLGLIWLDAHMDSHTPDTSLSGRLHGMPLACLLGQGDAGLTSLLHAQPKIKPQNTCLIGVRSFEKGEAALLKKLNVKIFYMKEVRERGFLVVLEEAIHHVKKNTIAYGISLDLDCLDPRDAPAVDVPEPHGIHAKDLLRGLSQIAEDDKLIAAEIVEFDPSRDKNKITEKLVVEILKALSG